MISDNLNNNFIFIYKIIIIIVIIVGVVGYLLYNNVFQTITTVAISDEENDLLNSYRGSNESFSNIEKFYNEGDKLCDFPTTLTKNNFFKVLKQKYEDWNGEENDDFIDSKLGPKGGSGYFKEDLYFKYYKEFQILFLKEIYLEMIQDDDFNKHDCDDSPITIDNICNTIQFSDLKIYNQKIEDYLIYKIMIMYKNNNSDNKLFRDIDSENRALVLKYFLPSIMFYQSTKGYFLIENKDETDLEQKYVIKSMIKKNMVLKILKTTEEMYKYLFNDEPGRQTILNGGVDSFPLYSMLEYIMVNSLSRAMGGGDNGSPEAQEGKKIVEIIKKSPENDPENTKRIIDVKQLMLSKFFTMKDEDIKNNILSGAGTGGKAFLDCKFGKYSKVLKFNELYLEDKNCRGNPEYKCDLLPKIYPETKTQICNTEVNEIDESTTKISDYCSSYCGTCITPTPI